MIAKGKAPRSRVRVIIPDSHGTHIDPQARAAILQDIKQLDPDEIVGIGDHLDCAGVFSSHARAYTNEMSESYESDAAATNALLDDVQRLAPRASEFWYLEGNHEARVERWAASTFPSAEDAKGLLERYAPWAVLRLKSRGIRYVRRAEKYMGIPIHGTIRLGKCYFTHGFAHGKHATSTHLERFGAPVVHGHTHRRQSYGGNTVKSEAIEAWCPGTLARLQPLYQHTSPTNWNHGYGVQFVNPSGLFLHINVPIYRGTSLLLDVTQRVA